MSTRLTTISRVAARSATYSTAAVPSAAPSSSQLPPNITTTTASTSSQSSSSPPPTAGPAAHHNLPSPVFGPHVPIKPKHGIHVATLHLRSHTTSLVELNFFTSFASRAARALAIPTTGTIALPTKTSLFTTPRSPFAHKKSQQNFWRKEHKRALKVYDASPQVVEAWLAFLRKEAMGGVGMKAQVFNYRELGWGQSLGGGSVKKADKVARSGVAELAKELQQELKLEVDNKDKEVEAQDPNQQSRQREPQVLEEATIETPQNVERVTASPSLATETTPAAAAVEESPVVETAPREEKPEAAAKN